MIVSSKFELQAQTFIVDKLNERTSKLDFCVILLCMYTIEIENEWLRKVKRLNGENLKERGRMNKYRWKYRNARIISLEIWIWGAFSEYQAAI